MYLGGIKIKSKLGTLGHSDGDPILHAITDAILGACRMGDIGEKFSDKSKKYKDIRSTILLNKVIKDIKSKNFDINNISEGDIIPQLQRAISQETINKYHELNNWSNKEPSPTALLHVDEAFAEATVFSGTTLSGPTAVGFMLHLVEKTFGKNAIINSTFNELSLIHI